MIVCSRARLWLTALILATTFVFFLGSSLSVSHRRILLPLGLQTTVDGEASQAEVSESLSQEKPVNDAFDTAAYGSLRSLPSGKPRKSPRIQYRFEGFSLWNHFLGGTKKPDQVSLAKEQVRETFLRSWQGYKSQAWGYDEVAPVQGGYRDTLGGWTVTLIGALDTLWVMDLKDEFAEAVEEVKELQFTRDMLAHMSLEKITTHILGGLLGAYDVSKGGYPILLRQAQALGNVLLDSFNTSNRMPTKYLDVQTDISETSYSADQMSLTELADLSLEFTRLAQLTGRNEYFDAVSRILEAMKELQPKTSMPGLWPDLVDATGCQDDAEVDGKCSKAKLASSGQTTEDVYSLSAGLGSVYSTILKQHLLLGQLEQSLEMMYSQATKVINSKLLFYPLAGNGAPSIQMTGNLIVDKTLDNRDNDRMLFEPLVSRSACSAGAMFALGSRVLSNGWGLSTAKRLTKGCIWGHGSSRSGVMPAEFVMMQCRNIFSCGWGGGEFHDWWNELDIRLHDDFDPDSYFLQEIDFSFERRGSKARRQSASTDGSSGKHYDAQRSQTISRPTPVLAHEDFVRERVWQEGLAEGMLDILSREYDLQPETLESIFTLYRVTGDETWRDEGWRIFDAINRMTAARYGNARLLDTTSNRDDRILQDLMQTWWLSATMKYAYLLFSEPDLISLDDFIFNSEGHPLRLPK